jgi:DNA-binding CsgD family transcriptional regulator
VKSGGLIGRRAEGEEIEALVGAVASGGRRVLLLNGEAGIGKSQLLGRAVSVAAQHGLQTFSARAEELERSRPFGAIARCLGITPTAPDRRRQEIARLLYGDLNGEAPPVAAPDMASAELEFRLIDGIVDLVEDLGAAGHGVAIAIDDLQWADASTLRVVHRLARLDDVPLLVCGTVRPVPRPPELAWLLHALQLSGATILSVAPLGTADVTELLASLVGQPPGPRLVRQAGAAGGNPFYVSELVSALRASGSLSSSARQAEIDAIALPSALKLTVLLEISFLSPAAQDVLRTASVLGTAFAVDDLSVVLGRSPVTLAPELREAMEAGVLHEEGSRLAFRHDVVREALYEDIPPALRSSIHLHVARTLAASDAAPLSVAEHFLRGASRGDAVALQWLSRAAAEATMRAPGMAADLLGRTVGLFDADDPERDLVVCDWVLCLEQAGRMKEAERVWREALRRPLRPFAEARLRLFGARLLSARNRFPEAWREVEVAMHLPGLLPNQRTRITVTVSILPTLHGRLDLAEATAAEGLRLARESDDAVAHANCALTLGYVAFNRARFKEADEWASIPRLVRDTAPSGRTSVGWQQVKYGIRILRSQVLLRLDQPEASNAELEAAVGAFAAAGSRAALIGSQVLQVSHAYFLGAWDDAVTEFDALVDACGEFGERPLTMQIAAGAAALIALHRGAIARARAALAEASADFPALGHLATLARALLNEASGDVPAAFETLADAWDAVAPAGVRVACLTFATELVRLAVKHGDRARASQVCDEIDAVAAANPAVATIEGTALRCRGLRDDDLDLLIDAAEVTATGPRPLDAALAAEDAADALGRGGRLDDAQLWFARALRAYEALDAGWDLTRTSARMRAVGLHRRARQTRERPRIGWEALTTAERAVVELVAQGLSNPEVAERLFLSRHTVKRHLANAMVKLGESSRRSLRGVVPPVG